MADDCIGDMQISSASEVCELRMDTKSRSYTGILGASDNIL